MIDHVTVDEEGYVRLRVEHPPGTRLRVHIEEAPANTVDASVPTVDDGSMAAGQARTGFARDILGAPEEEVWNEL